MSKRSSHLISNAIDPLRSTVLIMPDTKIDRPMIAQPVISGQFEHVDRLVLILEGIETKQNSITDLLLCSKQHLQNDQTEQVVLQAGKLIISAVFLEQWQNYFSRRALGSGGFSRVFSAQMKGKSEVFAVKLIDGMSSRIKTKTACREIKLISILAHTNIISLQDAFFDSQAYIKNPEDISNDSYFSGFPVEKKQKTEEVQLDPACRGALILVYQAKAAPIRNIIRSRQILSFDHLQFFMYQIFQALEYMHRHGVIHRDIKPENILVDQNLSLQIADFGLARFFYRQTDKDERTIINMTQKVQTRSYRAPEIILTDGEYDKPVDIWAAGIIMLEIMCRKQVFEKTTWAEVLQDMFELIGKPTKADFIRLSNPRLHQYWDCFTKPKKRAWAEIKPVLTDAHNKQHLAVDLVRRLVVFDPKKRLTAQEALNHPFFHFWSYDRPCCHGKNVEVELEAAFQYEKYTTDNSIEILNSEIVSTILQFHARKVKEAS